MLFNWNNLSGVRPAGEWHKGAAGCCHGVQSSRHNMDPAACRFIFLSDCDSLKGMPMPLNTLDVIRVWQRTALLSMPLALPLVNQPSTATDTDRSIPVSSRLFPLVLVRSRMNQNWTCRMIIWDMDLYWFDSFTLSFSWLCWPWREKRQSGVWFGLFVHKFSCPLCPS